MLYVLSLAKNKKSICFNQQKKGAAAHLILDQDFATAPKKLFA